METTVRKSLEIPARRHPKKTARKKAPVEKSFSLVINLWLFRYEYSKVQLLSDTPPS